jgi:PhnB protein
MVVSDSLAALNLYAQVFEIERAEVSALPRGQNEAIYTLYGMRFHLLDENPEFELIAPGQGELRSVWFNIVVPDIRETFAKAIRAGFAEIQPVTEIPDFGVSNAIVADPFGYTWLLHQVHREVSFEERTRLWEEKRES